MVAFALLDGARYPKASTRSECVSEVSHGRDNLWRTPGRCRPKSYTASPHESGDRGVMFSSRVYRWSGTYTRSTSE